MLIEDDCLKVFCEMVRDVFGICSYVNLEEIVVEIGLDDLYRVIKNM